MQFPELEILIETDFYPMRTMCYNNFYFYLFNCYHYYCGLGSLRLPINFNEQKIHQGKPVGWSDARSHSVRKYNDYKILASIQL